MQTARTISRILVTFWFAEHLYVCYLRAVYKFEQNPDLLIEVKSGLHWWQIQNFTLLIIPFIAAVLLWLPMKKGWYLAVFYMIYTAFSFLLRAWWLSFGACLFAPDSVACQGLAFYNIVSPYSEMFSWTHALLNLFFALILNTRILRDYYLVRPQPQWSTLLAAAILALIEFFRMVIK